MTRPTSIAPVMLFLMACTTVPPPEPQAAQTHTEPPPAHEQAAPACGDPAACFEEGKKAEAA